MPSYAVESRRTPSYAADGARRYVTVPGVGGDLSAHQDHSVWEEEVTYTSLENRSDFVPGPCL